MPTTKKPTETPEQQAERFREEVARLVAAGELNPTEADNALSRLVAIPSLSPRHKRR